MTTNDELRALAGAAVQEGESCPPVGLGDVTGWEARAAYIAAANPQRVLALLDRCAELEAEVRGLQEINRGYVLGAQEAIPRHEALKAAARALLDAAPICAGVLVSSDEYKDLEELLS